jgi:triosephosphate isomerase (TIM)
MKALIVANWKMNPSTYKEAKSLFDATKKAAEKAKHVQIIVAPPTIFLRQLAVGYRGRIALSIQNGFHEASGAHTGETSFVQAKDSRAAYALIGHAERRYSPNGGESNAQVREKVAAAFKFGLVPIVCIGEQERSPSGEHFAFVKEQIRIGLADVPAPMIKKILIAYEPVWAIGAPKPMQPNDMHEMAIFIRKTTVEMFGAAGMEIQILYGGSVDETSAPAMLRDGDVRGLLVGRASSEVEHMSKLLAAIERA